MAEKTIPLAALVTKFGGRISAGMLLADGCADNAFGGLAIKFGGGIPARMLMADGGTDNAFGSPGHPVWIRAPCGDTAG